MDEKEISKYATAIDVPDGHLELAETSLSAASFSQYQCHLKLLPIDSDCLLDRLDSSKVSNLKEVAGKVLKATSEAVSIYREDDSESVWIQVVISTMEQLKHLFHRIYSDAGKRSIESQLSKVYEGIQVFMSIENTIVLYENGVLQLDTLYGEQKKCC